MVRFIAIMLPITALVCCAGWASAQSVQVPPGMVCKVVKTTIESDKNGRTIITIKKVCEAK